MSSTKFLYRTTSEYIRKQKLNSTHVDITNFEPTTVTTSNKKLRNPLLIDETKTNLNPQINENFNYAQSTTEFRAKFPFVMVYVPLLQQTQFINECEWLQKKIGHFPSEADQRAILKSLGNVVK